MLYTVKKLAEISGVTSRTLRFYDEIGLLKPAYYGDNHYRYYGEEQLLMLQQILFFRELGFPLSDIQQVIKSDDFNKIEALKSHKNILKQELDRTSKLIMTIDKTIAHIQGSAMMNDEELYYGFDSEKQKEHERSLVEKGILTQEFLDECNAKTEHWNKKEKQDFIEDIERIMQALVKAIEQKLSPDSVDVQKLMREHYTWLERSWSPTKESYNGLAELYQTPDFRVFYDRHHPQLLDFMIKAMRFFAEKELDN